MTVHTWWPKTAIAGTILAIHTALLGGILWREIRKTPPVTATLETPAIVEIIQQQNARDKVPMPDLQFATPMLNLTALQVIQLDDSIDDELAAVIGPASAPRLARVQSVDPAIFARRARLLPGHAVTVVLRVEVMEDGLVGAADIVRPSGNIAADAAAIDYALAVRWIPGTNDRKPKGMRVTFPVTLAVPLTPSPSRPCQGFHGDWQKSKCRRPAS